MYNRITATVTCFLFALIVMMIAPSDAADVSAMDGSGGKDAERGSLLWGTPSHRIQTAMKTVRDSKNHTYFGFYVRNLTVQELRVDARPPFINKSRVTLSTLSGKEIDQIHLNKPKWSEITLAPHRVQTWLQTATAGPMAYLLAQAKGRALLTWTLKGATSPPVRVQVKGSEVLVYKDEWASVKHRFTLTRVKPPAGLDWGEATNDVQTAMEIVQEPKTGLAKVRFYARAVADHAVIVDADPPAANDSSIRLRSKDGALDETVNEKARQRFQLILLPDHARSWEEEATKSYVGILLEDTEGAVRLTWELNGAVSPPVYLHVDENRISVYEDRWKTVKFRFARAKTSG